MLQKTISKTIEKEYTCILMLCNAKTEVKPITVYDISVFDIAQ